jgi:Nucleoside-diphosphate-sugar pyrophosphorylase involved in lipopolysaccharide biosynthesis/translation initiation factor 2B, gamma/epsilon subunits (eIF-2Bgamma/eIF-2Bepsilon)
MEYAIIAAGEGSRLVQEGIATPKPLVRINGVALVDRLISLFLRNEASSISIIVNEEMKEVQQHLRNIDINIPLNIVVKSTPSSMHSFYELSRFLTGDKFCLTTVDTIFRQEDFAPYIRSFAADNEYDGMMAVTGFIDDEKPLYVAENPETGEITGFLDTPGDARYVSGGIYGLTPKAINVLKTCLDEGVSRMRNYQRRLIAEGLRLKACPFGKIVDVDHAEDIMKAELFLSEENIHER